MPFVGGGLTSFLQVGAKTWKPKTAEQQFLEAEQKRLSEEEQRRQKDIQTKIETLEHVRKLEAKTQALNEMQLSAEIRAKEHELAIRERQAAEAKQVELAKLELAKRLGRESLGEADVARIRRERMKAELLARAAENHAINENNRPIGAVDLGPPRTPMPPLPPNLQAVPPPPAPPSLQPLHLPPPSLHSVRPPSRVASAGLPLLSHSPMPAHIAFSSTPNHHLPPQYRLPTDPTLPIRSRRLSDTLVPQLPGIRGSWGLPGTALRGTTPYPPRVRIDPSMRRRLLQNEATRTELAFRAQAERLRRKRLETLDLKARQLDLKLQALREIRKRELANNLRERGIQQREIETQVRLLAERDRCLTEAQLREAREREHRALLVQKGLQEREIRDQIRRREERDRETLRIELEKLEREMRRKELLDAEMAIKCALESGQGPPMGILKPSVEEIEAEGLLGDDFWDEFDDLDPRLRSEILSETGITGDYRPRTPGGGLSSASLSSRLNYPDRHASRTPTVGLRTPIIRSHSPGGHAVYDKIRDEHARLREENRVRDDMLSATSRAPTPKMREDAMRSMAPRQRQENLNADRLHAMSGSVAGMSTPQMREEEMLGYILAHQPVSGRPRSQSFDRRSVGGGMTPKVWDESRVRDEGGRGLSRQGSRAALREDLESQLLNRDEIKAREVQRMRDDLQAREEHNRASTRTPAFRDSLEPYHHELVGGRQDVPQRSASRASCRGIDCDGLSRPLSRSGTLREAHDGVPLGLPSRPSSRNLTPADLGLDFGSRGQDRVSAFTDSSQHDELLAVRLQNAAFNSEINGRRSRANSRVEPVNDDLLKGATSQMASDLGPPMAGRRSRANSRADLAMDNPRNSLVSDFGPYGLSGGGRSRSNSRVEASEVDPPRNTRGQLASELTPNSAERRLRANGRAAPPSPDVPVRVASRNQLGSDLANVTVGGRARSASFNQTLGTSPNPRLLSEPSGQLLGRGASPRVSELGESMMQDDPMLRRGSKSPARFSTSGQGLSLSSYSPEQLAQMTTEQLEMLLASDFADRPGYPHESVINGVSQEEIAGLLPEEIDALLQERESGGLANGMRKLELSGAHPRSLSQRHSHARASDSPLFGSDLAYSSVGQGMGEMVGPLGRMEGGNGRLAGQFPGSSYDDPSGSRSFLADGALPAASRSLYSMPGHYDAYDEGGSFGDGYSGALTGLDHVDNLDEGEFIITESHEHPGARVIERLGTVQADSGGVASNPMAPSHDGLSERNEMHRAVRNLIAEASRRGANGVISLRVNDLPDGGHLASGEAVVLG